MHQPNQHNKQVLVVHSIEKQVMTIKYHLYHSFNEYKLPESLRKENEINMNFIDKQIEKTLTPAKDNNSGCLGIILLIAIPLSALYFLF